MGTPEKSINHQQSTAFDPLFAVVRRAKEDQYPLRAWRGPKAWDKLHPALLTTELLDKHEISEFHVEARFCGIEKAVISA
jgi:hypothetical protein